MKKRKLRLEKYGISGKRYKELCGFCEQYPEWKKKIADYPYIQGLRYHDKSEIKPEGINDPTFNAALKIERYESNCKLIEETAKLADAEFWQFIIKAVCYEVPLNYLITMEGMNLSQNAFYERRRYFFFLLDSERVVVGEREEKTRKRQRAKNFFHKNLQKASLLAPIIHHIEENV